MEKMIKIAIVEDDIRSSQILKSCISRYGEETDLIFDVSIFEDGANFLDNYMPKYDIVFMDIMMPVINGLDAAKKLREIDELVCLIFITDMAKYAIKGYSVNALDFMVKPINYYNFSMMMKRALKSAKRNRIEDYVIHSPAGAIKFGLNDIIFVEVFDHRLIYHTDNGKYDKWGKLSDLEAELCGRGFCRGNNSFLINLNRIDKIDGDKVTAGEHTFKLSRKRRKVFMRVFADNLSGNKE